MVYLRYRIEGIMKEETKKNAFFQSLDEVSSFFDLQLENMGVAVTLPQLELFAIASAPTFERLKQITSTIKEVSFPIDQPTITMEDFILLKQACIKAYQDSKGAKTPTVATFGVRETTYETFEKLAKELDKYNAFNVSIEASFEKVDQQGVMDLTDLKKIETIAKEKDVRINIEGVFDARYLKRLNEFPKEQAKLYFKNYFNTIVTYIASLLPYRIGKERVRTLSITHLSDPNQGIRNYFTLEEIIDFLNEAKRKIPNVDFIYQEPFTIDINSQKQFLENAQTLIQQVKTIDRIGINLKMTTNTKIEDITNFLVQMDQLNRPLEINHFELYIPYNEIGNQNETTLKEKKKEVKDKFLESLMTMLGRIHLNAFSIGGWTKHMSEILEEVQAAGTKVGTLYGGNYEEETESIPVDTSLQEVIEVSEKGQARPVKINTSLPKFNYHTHTKYCGHASSEPAEDYIQKAIQAGMKQLGFSDHVPLPYFIEPDPSMRMMLEQKDAYLNELRALKEKYKDQIEILIGFEAEYDESLEEYMIDLKEEVDYLVLAGHIDGSPLKKHCFRYDEEKKKYVLVDPLYPTYYAKNLVAGIKSGIYDFVAHPDYFMQFRDDFTNEQQRSLFFENALHAFDEICTAAKEMDIPLELNYAAIERNNISETDHAYMYPYPPFWAKAKEVENKVILGLDAHASDTLLQMNTFYEEVKKTIPIDELHYLDQYHPVEARRQNIKLMDALKNHYVTSETQEVKFVLNFCNQIIRSFEVDTSFSDIKLAIKMQLEREEKKWFAYRNEAKNGLQLKYIDTILRAYQSAKDSYQLALNIGCETTAQFILAMTQITEVKTTHNESKKITAYKALQNLEKSLQNTP